MAPRGASLPRSKLSSREGEGRPSLPFSLDYSLLLGSETSLFFQAISGTLSIVCQVKKASATTTWEVWSRVWKSCAPGGDTNVLLPWFHFLCHLLVAWTFFSTDHNEIQELGVDLGTKSK
jgi:hypothetical protein